MCPALFTGEGAAAELAVVQLRGVPPRKQAVWRGAGSYPRTLFGSTQALSVEQGLHLGVVQGMDRGCFGGVQAVAGGCRGLQGVFRACFGAETAQVELKSGRV